MSTDRFDRAAELFEQTLALPPDARAAFLAATCGDDEPLRTRVTAMLRADARPSPLLDATPDALATVLTPDPDDPPRLEGRRIGPYVIRSVLGRGGMGIVCHATREDVGKVVALKLVAGGLASPERVTRFLHERRVLARLAHPDIARLLDAGVTEDGSPWFAMDYVAGEPIDRYCDRVRPALDTRMALFERICLAVGYAHQHLVVHRDLKPTNILVGPDGAPCLLDFGIAKLLDGEATEETGAGQRLLTPRYAAPEQLRGEPVTTATDVYQLGTLLFGLLTGASARDSPADEPIPRPSTRAEDGPVDARLLRGDLDTIVGKATDPDPGQRYPTAQELAADVRRYRAGLPIEARPATVGYRIRKSVARHRAATAAGVTAVLVLIGFAVAMAVLARQREAERAGAEQVSDLLAEIFAGADPTVAQGDTVTIRSVLDRGALRVRQHSTLAPVIKAKLLRVVAQAYANLGVLPLAVELQSEAVALLRDAVSPKDPARLTALRELARWRAESGDPAGASGLIDEALGVARTLGRSRQVELAEILNDAGYVRQRAGDRGAAEPYYTEALAIFRTLPDTSSGRVATLTNLAFLAEGRGEPEVARDHLREALDRRRATLGEEHSATARSMLNLARILLRTEEGEEAERLVREAIAIQRRVFTSHHPDQIRGLDALASILNQRGLAADAEAAQREALDVARAIYGDGSGEVALATANLAGYVQRSGRLDDAAALYEEAVRQYRALVGERHLSTAVSTANLAWTERLRNRLAVSESLYRRALPVLDSAWGRAPQFANNLVDFGTVLSLRDNCAAAEPLLRRAVSLAGAWPPTRSDVIRAKRTHGLCLLQLGRLAAAESLLVDAHASLEQGFGKTNPWTVAATGDLATLYRRWGRPADAARYPP